MTARGALAPIDLQGLLAAKQAGLLGTGDMRTYQPSLRDRLAEAAAGAGRSMGLGDIIAQRMRDEAAVGADFMPGLGAAIGGEEAGRDLGAGNYLSGGLGLAMSMIPGGKAAKKGIRAFHGSPRTDIEKFKTRNPRRGWVEPSFFAVDEGTPRAEQYASGYRPDGGGSMYEVSIDPTGVLDARNPEDLQKIREALDKHTHAGARHFLDDKKGFQRSGLPGWGENDLFDALDKEGHRGVLLDERPDVKSVAIFDPEIIKIVKKYGIAATLGAGLITQEMAAQMQEQGPGGT